MHQVLLSIKPEFADLIFTKEKQYEFRRVIFKSPNVRRVVVYSSSPVQKVVGEFEIERVLTKSVNALWRTTRERAGINRAYYRSYFAGKEIGHAIKITSVKKYKHPQCLKSEYGIEHPPQSFIYLPSKSSPINSPAGSG